ncbi:probable RNA-directed DNA polymerase from transposon X-element [Trichonephila clavipes]|nr:probable RNA-directed DNA polymerase from transposon X-element [Trichonephila clavipes]
MLDDARSPSPKNSYMELYQMSTQAMARKKDEMVSELKTLPPCTRDDCNEHKIPTSLIVEESNFKEPTLDESYVRKVKKKKSSKKRKNTDKESLSSEGFIFPKKTARPVSPTSTQDPIETKNNFSDLEQDVEHPLPTVKNFVQPLPKAHFHSQIKAILQQLVSSTPIGSPPLKSRPPLQPSYNTRNIVIISFCFLTFLFGDFNAKHSSWNPGRSNATGNILSNWAVSSAIDIIAPDTPTHFNHNTPSTVIDIGFAANFSHSNVFTVNELSSDHNPVIFDFVTNCQLLPLLQTLKTTKWIKFQEILHYNMPGNPTVDNLDQAVQNFSNIVSDAINTSTSTRISKTSHLRLPINIREFIKTKNRFCKLWNNTRYPLYKREVNALIRQIRIEINEHKNRTWENLLSSLNVEDNSLYNLHKRITKKHTVIPPLHGPSGMAYSDFEKAEAFKDTLEVSFQENAEPYSDDKIEEVESLVNHYFDNFNTHIPPLTSPLEVRGIIKKLPNRKSPGPDQIPNIALKYLPINAITHLTKIYNRCLTLTATFLHSGE